MPSGSYRSLVACAALTFLSAVPAAAGTAKGTLSHKGRTVTLTHAYLVRGPDGLDPSKTIRKLILSSSDLGAKLEACTTMSCTDGEVNEGLTVDIGSGPRLNYWMALQNQSVQHSDTEDPVALQTTTDEPGKLAGKLTLDDTASGGPKLDVEFDAPLLKELTAAR